MSALRYCGDIRIRITYLAGQYDVFSDRYRCYLTAPGGAKATIIVGASAYLSCAVDSPEAFDSAARAAIAFADNGGDTESHDDFAWSDVAAFKVDGSGWHIGRSAATAWGSLGSSATACAAPANTNGS